MFAALDQTKGSDGITRQLSAKEVANLKAALGVIKPTKVDYVSHAQEKAQMQEEFPSSTDPTISKEKDGCLAAFSNRSGKSKLGSGARDQSST